MFPLRSLYSLIIRIVSFCSSSRNKVTYSQAIKLLNGRTPEPVIFQKGFLESNNNLGDQKVKKQLVSACKMTSFHARPPSKSTEDSNPANPTRDIDKTIPTLKMSVKNAFFTKAK
ncbi:uncharacterized protein LOC126632828 [Malus sylvestris]|uniref:uncharacterized protein LOC126632828 n=1 Tax=Malus sylvestris TaxID=3752 RepID=UPI0021ABCB0F|nr:uncharacterized protein LOC126632828 [Malus sylvestris]